MSNRLTNHTGYERREEGGAVSGATTTGFGVGPEPGVGEEAGKSIGRVVGQAGVRQDHAEIDVHLGAIVIEKGKPEMGGGMKR